MRATTAMTAVLLSLAGSAFACDPVSWSFDESTTGQDISWTSPSNVDNGAPRYDVAYEITLLEVRVSWLIFEFTVDVTEQVPPELRSGAAVVDGPPPIVLFTGSVEFPPPPEKPGFAADIDMRIDANGFGQLSMTNVVLGEVEIEIPGFGVQTVQLEEVRMAGNIGVTPIGPLGDVNGDLTVDFSDLLDVLGTWGLCPDPPDPCPGDLDGDGMIGFGDLLIVLAQWGQTYQCE